MARAARWLMGALGGAIVLFAVGPRSRVRLEGAPPNVPSTPEAVADRIAKREAAVEGLRLGTEARITWGGEAGRKTPLAFVYIHGFSASRRETAPLSENLAKAYGANLYEARLAGHGRPGEALGRVTAEEWVRDTREALAIGRVIGDKVVVIAASTGATLTMLVAAHDKPEVAAYVLLSPNFGLKNAASSLLLWPWADRWMPWVMGKERSWEPENPEHGKYWTTRYPVDALFPMMAIVERARTAPLYRVKTPVLMLYAEDDPVVDTDATEAAFLRLSAAEPRERQRVDGPGDLHVIAGDILAPARTRDVERRVRAFLDKAGVLPAP